MKVEIMYSPADAGKEVMNAHGRLSKIRKYHMTASEMDIARKRWLKVTADIDDEIVGQAGPTFFNPYRKGVYYYQIYAMYLLGANEWHSLSHIISKMKHIMSKVLINKEGMNMTAWERFRGKSSRLSATRCKDFMGRIQENMIFFQRLNRFHPTGYKLRQVCSAVDMKRITKKGFSTGCYEYRLHTYDKIEKALPIRDYQEFEFPLHERRYISYKFIGTIITKDKVVTKGKTYEVPSM